jgi:hypothetical protein
MQRLRQLKMINGFIIALGNYRQHHKDNRDLIDFWDSISRHERILMQIEEAFKDTLMCDAINVSPDYIVFYVSRRANITKVPLRERHSRDP